MEVLDIDSHMQMDTESSSQASISPHHYDFYLKHNVCVGLCGFRVLGHLYSQKPTIACSSDIQVYVSGHSKAES